MKMGMAKGNFGASTTQSIAYDSALGDAEAFVLFVTNHTTTGTLADGNGLCIWMSDGTNEHSAFSWISATSSNNQHDRGRNVGGYLEENGTVRMDGTSSINTANNRVDFTFDASEVPDGYEYCLITFHGTDVNALCVSHDGTDQTESIGFDWDFLVSTGASTTSTTSTNCALNWGVCDKSGNQGVVRHGAGNGTSIHFSVFRNDAINANIFNVDPYEILSVDNITTNSFDLNCSVASNNDEPGVYLCIGCSNDVEVVTNQTLTASTGDENVTVSHVTEYALFGGVVGTSDVNTIEYSLSGGEPSLFVGACDLSGGADTSGDYFAYGWGGSGANVEAELTHTGCIVGTTGTGGSAVSADISSVGTTGTPSPTVVGKATAGTTTRMWFLNIGPEPAAGNPTTTAAAATATGTSAKARTSTSAAAATSTGTNAKARTRTAAATAAATATGTNATARTQTAGATATATGTSAKARTRTSVTAASATATATRASTKSTAYAASATATANNAVSGNPVSSQASATASGVRATASTTSYAATATSSGTSAKARTQTAAAATATAAGLDGSPAGGFPTSRDWNETDYENALTFADLFDNEPFNGFQSTYSIPTDYNSHSHYGATEAQSWSDYTYTGRMYRAGSTIGIGVTVYSDYPNSDTYYRLRVNGTTSIWNLNGHPDAGGSPISETYSGPNPTNNEVFFKVKVTNESGQVRVQAKVWDGGEENEPAGWNLEAVDTGVSRPTSGTVGLWTSHNPSVSNTSKAYWYDLKVDLGDGNGPQDVPLQSQLAVTTPAYALAVARSGQVDPTTLVASATATANVGVTNVSLVASATATARDAEVGTFQNSVTQYGITWTFDGNYKVGQYITGDWWVLAPSGMTINSVSPTPTATSNGSMKNPATQTATAYDSRASYSDMSQAESFPLAMSAGDSLVSTISAPDPPESEFDVIGLATTQPKVSAAAVLTVVASEPTATAFRPQYSGNGTKTTYDFADVDTSLLPNLTPTAGAIKYNAQGGTDIEAIERQFARPWILHGSDFVGRQIHPKQNMPDYHEYVYEVISDAALKLLTTQWTQAALVGFIQAGIDNYFCSLTGTPDSSASKYLSIFAGIMLGDATLLSDARGYRTGQMAYYISDGTSTISSSIVPSGETWTGATVGWRQDPGDSEHEHLDPATEWNLVANTGSGGKREHYRRENSKTWPGMALAARLMNLTGTWNHAAFFDYVDRWMTEPDAANYAFLLSIAPVLAGGDGTLDGNPTSTPAEQSSSTFVNNMWDAYRSTTVTTVATATATASNATPKATTRQASATASALDGSPASNLPETVAAAASATGRTSVARTRTSDTSASATATARNASPVTENPTASSASASCVATTSVARTRTTTASAEATAAVASPRLRVTLNFNETITVTERSFITPFKLSESITITESSTVTLTSATIVGVDLVGRIVTISANGKAVK